MYLVRSKYSADADGAYLVKDSVEGTGYSYTIPEGMTLYFISSWNLLKGAWLILDVRPGENEYRNEPGDDFSNEDMDMDIEPEDDGSN